ncbi:antigen LPMC-61 [Eurosta solidaginis]|uniref:antigen LPMC-61 n=1 Tax=Eurosta solidaginis TaxID=178769 RepID=UPI0035313B68
MTRFDCVLTSMTTTTTKLLNLGLCFVCLIHASTAQLSYHTDSNSNSFTLKTPSLQQSFSRVYGGSKQPQQLQQQQQPQQPLQHQQISSTAPQQLQRFAAQPYAQPQALQQQQQSFSQPQQYSSFQYTNAADATSPYQQQQALQYAQQQQTYPSYATPQYASATPSTPTYTGGIAQQHYAQTLQQIQQQQYEQQLEQLQQQQQQQQTRYSAQKSSTPNQVEQLQAAYLAYQQQQQQQQLQQQQQQQQQHQQQYVSQEDYQQQLLRQLYNEHRPTAAAFNAGASHQTSPIYNTSDYANYMQHQQQLAERTFGSAPTAATLAANNGLSSTTPLSPSMSSTTEKLLGIQYSPSNKVSHVKFSSGNLHYNF